MNRHVPPEEFDNPEANSRFTSRAQPDFKAAARHSARVRWIKRLLPVGVIAAALGIGASVVLSQLKLDVALPVDIGRISLSGSQLTMQMPHLSGFTDDGRGYSVNARIASQNLKNPDILYLSVIEARMDMANKKWVEVGSRKGRVNIKTQIIELTEGITVAMDGGYAGTLKDATIDVKKGELTTKDPVVFTLYDSKIVADALTVTESGDVAVFNGNVQVDFLPAQLRDPKAAQTGASQPSTQTAAAAAAPAPTPVTAPASTATSAAPASQPATQTTTAPVTGPEPKADEGTQAAQAEPAAPAATESNDVQEGPIPTARVPLPPRKPPLQTTALPAAYAPLPPPKPGSFR